MIPTVHTLKTPSGEVIYILQEGNQFTQVEKQQSMNGLFSKGGFFDKAIKTASGVFKKKDGTPTFIGESIHSVANSFGEKLGNNLTKQHSGSNKSIPTFNPNIVTPGGNSVLQPPGGNPLPPSKDNTMAWVLGTAAVIATGTGIYFATKKKQGS